MAKVLRILAGPAARRRLAEQDGCRCRREASSPLRSGARGLVLSGLDRFCLASGSRSEQPVHLVGASIGAWQHGCTAAHRLHAGADAAFRDMAEAHVTSATTPRLARSARALTTSPGRAL